MSDFTLTDSATGQSLDVELEVEGDYSPGLVDLDIKLEGGHNISTESVTGDDTFEVTWNPGDPLLSGLESALSSIESDIESFARLAGNYDTSPDDIIPSELEDPRVIFSDALEARIAGFTVFGSSPVDHSEEVSVPVATVPVLESGDVLDTAPAIPVTIRAEGTSFLSSIAPDDLTGGVSVTFEVPPEVFIEEEVILAEGCLDFNFEEPIDDFDPFTVPDSISPLAVVENNCDISFEGAEIVTPGGTTVPFSVDPGGAANVDVEMNPLDWGVDFTPGLSTNVEVEIPATGQTFTEVITFTYMDVSEFLSILDFEIPDPPIDLDDIRSLAPDLYVGNSGDVELPVEVGFELESGSESTTTTVSDVVPPDGRERFEPEVSVGNIPADGPRLTATARLLGPEGDTIDSESVDVDIVGTPDISDLDFSLIAPPDPDALLEGESFELGVEVVNESSRSVTIDRVEVAGDLVALGEAISPGGSETFTEEIIPTSPGGQTWDVRVEHPVGADFEETFEGLVGDVDIPPEISLATPEPVNVHENADPFTIFAPLRVENDGGAADVTLESPAESVTQTVGEGTTETVNIDVVSASSFPEPGEALEIEVDALVGGSVEDSADVAIAREAPPPEPFGYPIERADTSSDFLFSESYGGTTIITELDLLSHSDGVLSLDFRAQRTGQTRSSRDKTLDIYVNDELRVEGASWQDANSPRRWVSNTFDVDAELGDEVRVEWQGYGGFSNSGGPVTGTLRAVVVGFPEFEAEPALPDSPPTPVEMVELGLGVTNVGRAEGEVTIMADNEELASSVPIEPGQTRTVAGELEPLDSDTSLQLSGVRDDSGDEFFSEFVGVEIAPPLARFEVDQIILPDTPPLPGDEFELGLEIANPSPFDGDVRVEIGGDMISEARTIRSGRSATFTTTEFATELDPQYRFIVDNLDTGDPVMDEDVGVDVALLDGDGLDISPPTGRIRAIPGELFESVVAIESDADIAGNVRVEHEVLDGSGYSISSAEERTITPGESMVSSQESEVPFERGVGEYDLTASVYTEPDGELVTQETYTLDVSADVDDISVSVPAPEFDVVAGTEFGIDISVGNDGDEDADVLIVHNYVAPDGSEISSEFEERVSTSGATITDSYTVPAEEGVVAYEGSVEVYTLPDEELADEAAYNLDVRTPIFEVQDVFSPPTAVAPFEDFELGLSVVNVGDAAGEATVEVAGETVASSVSMDPDDARSFTTSLSAPSDDANFGTQVINMTTDTVEYDERVGIRVEEPIPEFEVESVIQPNREPSPGEMFEFGARIRNVSPYEGTVTVEVGDEAIAVTESIEPRTVADYTTRLDEIEYGQDYRVYVENDRTGEAVLEEQRITVQSQSDRREDERDRDGDDDDDRYDGPFTYLDPFGAFGTTRQLPSLRGLLGR